MTGETALITGGTRGIGLAVAEKLAAQGANVALLYAGNDEAAARAVARLQGLGARALALRADVSDSGAVNEAVRAVKAEFGGLHHLVNNAGITRDGLALRMRDDDFARVLDVNLKGAFYAIRAVLPDFIRARRGRIVNVSSVSGIVGNAGQCNYAAAKAGLIALTKSVAREVASRGITVNAVAPGFVETEMTAGMNEQTLAAALAAVPLKRIGQAREIADAIAFLLSDGASYITGAVLPVDGGLAM